MTTTDWSFLAGRRVVQLVAHLAHGDAISNEARTIVTTLRAAGVDTLLVADHCDEGLQREMVAIEDYQPQAGDLVALHYSIWSKTAAWVLERQPAGAVMIYHNVTPPHWFAGVNPQAEAETRFARDVLRRFASVVDVALGDSPHNEQELIDAGFGRTGVLPIMMDQHALEANYNRDLAARLMDGRVNWLFVGRIAPNKCQHDVVAAFAAYHRRINPNSRLTITGSPNMATYYLDALKEQARVGGVSGAVAFPGHVAREDLLAYYRAADVFVCMSEHEGFCVPIVEAMALGVPIVAFAAAAVPGTMGDAGVLLHRKVPALTAEVVHQVVSNRPLLDRLVARGRDRAADFSQPRVEAELARWLRLVSSKQPVHP